VSSTRLKPLLKALRADIQRQAIGLSEGDSLGATVAEVLLAQAVAIYGDIELKDLLRIIASQ